MAILPYQCTKHGNVDAYAYTMKAGKRKGLIVKVCRKCRQEIVKADWLKVKTALIKAYGGKCDCCGEKEPRFLTLDHTHGNGAEHRQKVGRGWRLYQWLARRGYPKKGFRLLCWNCNCSRGQYGKCPHAKAQNS